MESPKRPCLCPRSSKVHRDPLPAARPFNKTGIKLSPRVMRAVRRGVAQINRGEGIEFTSGAEAAAYLRKQARKA